jgi:nitroimidazol reductase NimA-like FMN-containing flavoprotein (pyridoxamine 5'-phosphate oxidase superfamily)
MTDRTDRQPTSHFVELSPAECHDRLTAHTIGRVAWSTGGLPHVLPVTYALYNGKVVFRTAPYGLLADLASRTNVAFEVDEIDEATGRGWSVVVDGHAQSVSLAYDLTTLWAKPGLVPWAPGTRNLFIAITQHAIAGRSVRAPFAD